MTENDGLIPGGVSIDILNQNLKMAPTIERHGSFTGGTTVVPDGAAADMAKALGSIDLTGITNKIEAGLAGSGHLILPGNGTFKMTSPRLNNNGDFLCRLTYLPSELGPPNNTNDINGNA